MATSPRLCATAVFYSTFRIVKWKMKKLFQVMLCGALLTTFSLGCGGNPTDSGDNMPTPSADPSAGEVVDETAKPSAEKAAKGDESGDKKAPGTK